MRSDRLAHAQILACTCALLKMPHVFKFCRGRWRGKKKRGEKLEKYSKSRNFRVFSSFRLKIAIFNRDSEFLASFQFLLMSESNRARARKTRIHHYCRLCKLHNKTDVTVFSFFCPFSNNSFVSWDNFCPTCIVLAGRMNPLFVIS